MSHLRIKIEQVWHKQMTRPLKTVTDDVKMIAPQMVVVDAIFIMGTHTLCLGNGHQKSFL